MPIRFRLAVLVLAVACSTSSRSISVGAQAGGGSVGRFHDFVDSVRVAEGWPGLAVIVVRDTGTPLVVATGVRRVGSSDPLLTTDRMHIGSNGKAITATLVGALVQRREMTLETTVIDAFPEETPAELGAAVWRRRRAARWEIPGACARRRSLPPSCMARRRRRARATVGR